MWVGQDRWIRAMDIGQVLLLRVLNMVRDGVEVQKHAKKNEAKILPATLTE